MRRIAPLIAAVAVGSLFVTPRPAAAQLLKGIKKAAQDAAKKKVEEKIDGKPAEAPASGTSGASGGASAGASGSAGAAAPSSRGSDPRNQDVLITPERIEFVLAAYRPMLPEITRQVRFYAQADSAERAKERFDACIENAKEAFNKLSQAQQTQTMMALAEKGTAGSERYQAIKASGIDSRYAAAIAADRASAQTALLADSVQGVDIMMALPMLPGGAKCGKYPFLPVAAAQAMQARLKNQGPDGQPRVVYNASPTEEAKAAMSKEQFGRINERIAFWALQQLGFYDGDNVTVPFSPFTPEELAALNAKKKELMPLGEAWAMAVARWARWSQIAW